MNALKKIEENTASLAQISVFFDEIEALGPALKSNPTKQKELLKESKNILSLASEVTSLHQHNSDNKEIHVAYLQFQQASAPLLSRLTRLQETIGPIRAPVGSGSSSGDGQSYDALDKNTKKVSMAGWLRKKGVGTLANSHRRYFAVDPTAPTQLRYYENEQSTKPKGYIPLDQMEAVLVGDDKTTFSVQTPSRTWHLQADNEHNAKIWIRLLTKWGDSYHQRKNKLALNLAAAATSTANSSNNPPVSPNSLGRPPVSPPPSPHSNSQPSSSLLPNTLLASSSVNPNPASLLLSPEIRNSTTDDVLAAQVESKTQEMVIAAHLEAERRELIRREEQRKRFAEKDALRRQREAAEKAKYEAARQEAARQQMEQKMQQQQIQDNQQGLPINDSQAVKPNSTMAQSTKLNHSLSPNSMPIAQEGTNSPSKTESPTVLREKLRAVMKQRKEQAAILAELTHQKELFSVLKHEKQQEIQELQDNDPQLTELRAHLEETTAITDQLKKSISTYKQQIEEKEKLVAKIQLSTKAAEEKEALLDTQIIQLEEEFKNLNASFASIAISLSSVALDRMISHHHISSIEAVDHRLEIQAEAWRAHSDHQRLLEADLQSRTAAKNEQSRERINEADILQQKLDTLRSRFQYLRTILNTNLLNSEPTANNSTSGEAQANNNGAIEQISWVEEEIAALKHDIFVAIANGIKLNLVQEGHMLKITSPSELYNLAIQNHVQMDQWPKWISEYIHTNSIAQTDSPLLMARRPNHMAPNIPKDAELHESDNQIHSDDYRLNKRRRRRNVGFGTSLGANLGGGSLMLM